MTSLRLVTACLTVLVCLPHPVSAKEIVLDDALVLPPVRSGGRSAIHIDALEAEILAGRWKAPKEGDKPIPGRDRAWEAVKAKNGFVEHRALRGGYLFWKVTLDAPAIMMLDAAGHSLVTVNGEPRTGDPYSHGFLSLPVSLRKGDNELLFLVGRGQLRAKLVPPPSAVYLDLRDLTQPTLLTDQKGERLWVGLMVVNATAQTQDRLTLDLQTDGATVQHDVPSLTPLTVRKIPLQLPPLQLKEREATVRVRLRRMNKDDKEELSKLTLTLPVRKTTDLHVRTFQSSIDGSVQFYAVQPAVRPAEAKDKPALFLSLHGASVNADGQAAAYSKKNWGHIVAPTNRRPFGFDWEDWGRMDAMEVLDHAQKALGTDPRRTYLTGHSMGGHGTWHLGATYPDRFAAIGPSAGWISFWTYGSPPRPEKPNPAHEICLRASSGSETMHLLRNYEQHGVYILHGDRDDNVPVNQARTMRRELEKFHRDMNWHEQPGAGHWWDASDEDGTDCVDWGPMFDFFARRIIPPSEIVRKVRFTTTNPGVSSRNHWLTIAAQVKTLAPSTAEIQLDPGRRRFRGTTENVARLALDLAGLTPGAPFEVILDEQKIEKIAWPEKHNRLWLSKKGDKWGGIAEPSPALKGPHRNGPFKEAFRNRVLFLYGTKGSAAENAWALAKARLDAETFWYRGNGSIDVLPDTAFDAVLHRDRNVILYGHSDSNAAWKTLLANSPVQVKAGEVKAGERTEKGDLACVFLQPRADSETALVGVVSGTSVTGMRLTDQLALFISGSGFPDFLLLEPAMLTAGYGGVRGAGFFADDWKVSGGDFIWAKP